MARENDTSETDGAPLWNIAAGLDRSVVPVRINDLGLAEAMNVVIVDGVIKPRSAMVANRFGGNPGSSGGPPAMFFNVRERDSQEDVPIFLLWGSETTPPFRSLTAYRWTGVTWTLLSGFGSATSSFDTPPQATAFKDVAIVIPGDGNPRVWVPGTSDFSELTSNSVQPDAALKAPIDCRYVESSGSRVFMANGAAYGGTERLSNRVWWSDSGTYNVWSNGTGKPERGSASFEDLQQGEFGTYEITALKMHSAMQLLVWKAWGIWAATWAGDVVTWTFVPGTFKIGTIASKTIQQWRDKLVFLGTDCNIYAIDVGRNVVAIGDKMQRYISRIINPLNANRSFAAVDPIENQYKLFIPVGTSDFPNWEITLNLETMSFTEQEYPCQFTSAYSYFPGFDALPGIFLTQYANNGVMRELSYTPGCNDKVASNAAEIGFSAHIWSKVYDYNEMYRGASELGEIHKIALHGDRGKATAVARSGQGLYELQNATSPDLLTFGELDVTTNTAHYVSERTQSARFVQWGVEWAEGEDDPLHLQGVTVYGLPRGGFERGGG